MIDGRRIGREIGWINNLIRRKINGTDMHSERPTYMQGGIIVYLMNNDGPIYQRDVEKRFNIRRSTATGILKGMEKDGLIMRVPEECDARLKRLVLTDKAKDNYLGFLKKADEIENIMIDGISKEDIDTFYDVIDKIKTNLSR